MTHYLYPQNLRAVASLWLWSLRDFVTLSVAALLSAVLLVELRLLLPAAATLCYGFLTIRLEEATVLDFLRWAARYFVGAQQRFAWRQQAEDEK